MLAEVIDLAFKDELDQSNVFRVVQKTGPQTLILIPSVVDIASTKVRRSKKKETVVTAATLYFDLIDAETGNIILRLAERRKIQSLDDPYATPENASMTTMIEQWSHRAAEDLRNELENLRVPL